MKLWKKMIIPLAILVALTVGLLVVNHWPQGGNTVAETTVAGEGKLELPSYTRAQVSKVRVASQSGDEYTFTKTDDSTDRTISWDYESKETKKEEYLLNQTDLNNAVQALVSYARTTGVPDGLSKLSEYGLDKPQYTIEITAEDGVVSTVEIGNVTFDGRGVYCFADFSTEVSIVPIIKLETCQQSILNVMEKEIFVLTEEEVSGVDFFRASDQLALSALIAPAEYGSMTQQPAEITSGTQATEVIYEATIVEPLKINGSLTLMDFFRTAMTVTASEFISVDENDVEKYGLNNPEYSLVFHTTEKGDIQVDLSKDMGGFYYVKTSLSSAIFSIETLSLSGLQMPLISMVNNFVTYQMIYEVSKIEASFPEGDFVIELELDKDDSILDPSVTSKLNGTDVKIKSDTSIAFLSTLFTSSACIRMSGFDFEAEPENNKDISIVISLTNGTKKILDFSAKNEFSYYVFLNGEYSGQTVSVDAFYKKGGSDLFGYGTWAMYELILEAMDGAVNGIYPVKNAA